MRALALLLLLLACTAHLQAEPDEVDKAISSLFPKTGNIWLDSLSVGIYLPANTPVEKIVASIVQQEQAFQQQHASQAEPFKNYHIVASKKVKLTEEYFAIVIESTNEKRTLILTRYLPSPQACWWYDILPIKTAP